MPAGPSRDLESNRHMAGRRRIIPPGGNQHDVEAAVARLKLRPDGDVSRRGTGDPPALAGEERFRRLGDIRPCLDLDEGQDGPTPGDDVDLPRGGAVVAGKDAIAHQAQGQQRQALRLPAAAPGPLALRFHSFPSAPGRAESWRARA